MKKDGCLTEVTELRAIGSDKEQWMLLKRTKKRDPVTKKAVGGYSQWNSYKYFHTYEAAATYLAEELIRTSGATTFNELLRTAEKIREMIADVHERTKV